MARTKAAKAVNAGMSAIIQKLKSEGKLKEYANLDELQRAREARKKRGVPESPAHLLPDDHFRKRKRSNITMSPQSHALAKKIGNGIVSRGIERALEHYFDCPRTDRRRIKE